MNEKDFLDKIKNISDSETDFPNSISPKEVVKMLNNQKTTTNKSKIFKFGSIAAACLVLVLSFSIIMGQVVLRIVGQPPQPADRSQVITLPEATQEGAGSYEEIFNAIKSDSNKAGSDDDFLTDFGRAVGEVFDSAKSFSFGAMESSSEMVTEDSALGKEDGSSTTNIQVDGVDEADVIKNDDRYIYYWKNASQGGEIIIFDAGDPNNVKKTGSIKFTDKSVSNIQMYLNGSTLTLLWSENSNIVYEENRIMADSYYPPENQKAFISVYDVSDPSQPENLREFSQDGYINNSRMIEDVLYLVTSYAIYGEPADSDDVEAYVPKISDSVAENTEPHPIDSGCILLPEYVNSKRYTVVSAIDTKNVKKTAETKATLGGADTVYASKTNLYLLGNEYKEEGNATSIQRFAIIAGNIIPTGAASVPGNLLNQFSVDEYNDYFRIATTQNAFGTGMRANMMETYNNMFVLDKDLKLTGSITDIAPGERIYSVRYMGEKAYMVTFRQTDPLFSIDLSDPSNPVITGQLKIPGFSTYMHPITDNLMLGIGSDANEETGQTKTGIKLSLFDVSKPEQPLEKFTQNFFSEYSYAYSPAAYDHKTFVNLGNGLYGMPVNKHNNTGEQSIFAVFEVSENSIELRAEIQTPVYQAEGDNYYNWREIRGVRIGDVLCTISNDNLRVSSMDDFSVISDIRF